MKEIKKIQPVILCGGSGTRLWPLSRKSFPKQFIPLVEGKSLLQSTFERVASFSERQQIWTVASEEHRFLVRDAAKAAQLPFLSILEPVGRNTSAAMAVAALNAKPDQLLLFTPADHYLPDVQLFKNTVEQGAIAADQGDFVTFGITPHSPDTGYGYIKFSQSGGFVKQVIEFIEKPNKEKALSYLSSGDYCWNSGIFLVRADSLLSALVKFAPDIFFKAKSAVEKQIVDGDFIHLEKSAFESCRSESIDYAVLESLQSVSMVPFQGAWSDVGGWKAMADLAAHDDCNNSVVGHGITYKAKDTYINSSSRPVVALGTEGLIIVDSSDALLVASKGYAEQVKDVVEELRKLGLSQADEHRHVARPWGEFDSVDEGDAFKVKRIKVNPGASLSLQMHQHRAEHWVVVQGKALVTRGEESFVLNKNESTFIPVGTKHRLVNPGESILEIIEIQSGSYLGEDDIFRFEDVYGRKT